MVTKDPGKSEECELKTSNMMNELQYAERNINDHTLLEI